MSMLHYLSPQEAQQWLEQGAKIADIRDLQSFAAGHIPGAVHLHNGNLQAFIQHTEFEQPIIICCYHGISSQSAGQLLIQHGFDQVSSLNGGFERWQQDYPDQVEY